MKLLVVAVGQRVPAWAQAGWDEYVRRFPPDLRVELRTVKTEVRASRTLPQLLAAERERLSAAIPPGTRIVALDERGTALTTVALAERLGVWQQAASFRRESRLSTWIMGIAYRCVLKSLRQHGEQAQAEDELTVAQLSGNDPGEDRERADWVGKGLQRLPPDQRLVLELAYGGGHSVDEIAAILQCPEGTVKARMFHARTKLRHLLPALAGRTGTEGP